MTHTLEVAQNARTIARALRLNEDLTEAIALGHDLGHTPFGHAGERALARVCPGGFEHQLQSLRVVERLERPVMIPLRRQKYLGFSLQPAERLAVQNPVPIPLVLVLWNGWRRTAPD